MTRWAMGEWRGGRGAERWTRGASWNARIIVGLSWMMATAISCRPPADTREARDFERMREQQRYDAYGPSRFFNNGAVMQAPPAHTIPRETRVAESAFPLPIAFTTGRSSGDTSDYATEIPIPVDDRLRALGAKQFEISCAPCHGAGGFGGGPIAPNLVDRRPPSLLTPAIGALRAGMIFTVITNGFGRMPPYGWQLSPVTRWAVITYVRSLASQPMNAAMRADSVEAASLHRLDSLRAAGANVEEMTRNPENELRR